MGSRKPNIILIITDHHAYYGHGREGGFTLPMENFETLGREGVRFDRAYSVCPICTPARCSMMSGVYPSAHGLPWNTDGGPMVRKRDFSSGTLLYSHFLSRAGYRNAYVGKWHCGREKLPVDFGIEGWSLPDYGKVYMSEAYRKYAEERGLGDARARVEHNVNHPDWKGKTLTLHDPSPWTFMNSSGVLVGPPEAHEEQFVAHLAVEKMRELSRSDQPFSLVVSFWGPHQAYFPTEPYASLFDPEDIPEYPSFRDDLATRPLRHILHREHHHPGVKRWSEWRTWQEILARCYGQIAQTDAAIGQVMNELGELGLAEDTLVLCCADHGDSVACHGGLWDKASTYTEEVGRVPMAMRWPTGMAGGKRISRAVSNMDVTATMLAAAGVEVPEWMHSASLLELARDPDTDGYPDTVICEHNGHGEDLLMRIAVDGRYKYVAALFDGDELYDLETDPWETHNVVNDPQHRPIREKLRGKLIDHMRSTKDRTGGKLLTALTLGL